MRGILHHQVDRGSRRRRGCSRRRRSTGRSQIAAMLTPSWKAPSATAPSPKKQATTSIGLLHLERQRHARGERNAAADDRDAGHHALVHVADVHRSALAPAAAGRRRRTARRAAPRSSSPLARAWPWPRKVEVMKSSSSQRGADADRRRLLALALMDRAGHRALQEQELHPFLELADADHALEQLEPEAVVAGRAHASASIRAMTSPTATLASGGRAGFRGPFRRRPIRPPSSPCRSRPRAAAGRA